MPISTARTVLHHLLLHITQGASLPLDRTRLGGPRAAGLELYLAPHNQGHQAVWHVEFYHAETQLRLRPWSAAVRRHQVKNRQQATEPLQRNLEGARFLVKSGLRPADGSVPNVWPKPSFPTNPAFKSNSFAAAAPATMSSAQWAPLFHSVRSSWQAKHLVVHPGIRMKNTSHLRNHDPLAAHSFEHQNKIAWHGTLTLDPSHLDPEGQDGVRQAHGKLERSGDNMTLCRR